MSGLTQAVLVNAATACLFAAAAWLATIACARRPALAHLLWVAVLVELLAPPVIGVGIVPRWDQSPALAGDSAPFAPPAALHAVALRAASSATSEPIDATGVAQLGALWLAGSLALLGLALTRALRFKRLLRDARPCVPEWQRRLEVLGAGLGLARIPRMRITDARISPLVWQLGGPAELIVPAGLLERLSPDELDAVLAHELAHVRRRDPWIRWIELGALCAYWWHPVAWWARARLRRLEERSCDELVLHAFPGIERDYARGLLSTLEYLVRADRPVPALACGIGRSQAMKERLTMILTPSSLRPLPNWARFALAAAVLALVLVFPTWAERGRPDAQDEPKAGASRGASASESPQDERLVELEALEREAEELQQALEEVRQRQRVLRSGVKGEPAAEGSAFVAHASEIERRRAIELDRVRELVQEELERARTLVEVELERALGEGKASGLAARDEALAARAQLQTQLREELAAQLEALRAAGTASTESEEAMARLNAELAELAGRTDFEATLADRQRAEIEAQVAQLREQSRAFAAASLEDRARELELAARELESLLRSKVVQVY